MLPKLGIVSIGAQAKPLNWVRENKPVSIIVVNERGESRPQRPWENNEIDMIRAAMGASPKTLWIFRSWPDGIGEGGDLLSRLVLCSDKFMDMPNPKMGHSFNEPGSPWIQTSGDAHKLMKKERRLASALHEYGLLSMNFCFSESHLLKGNMGLWEIYAEALEHCDALGFNEYDKPGMRSWGELWREHDHLYRLGHWEEQRKRILKVAGSCPPIVLGEGLVDMKCQDDQSPPGRKGGWRTLNWRAKQYLALHQAVHDASYHKEGAFSHHTFCYPQPYDWLGYSIEPILDQLGQLVQGAPKVYWEDKEEEMPTPPADIWANVPEEIAQWKELIGEVTSTHHVPIPDYNGVAISPAKLMAAMIRHESRGDPNARSDGARGLMQVWADHYPNTNLFDPKTNLEIGLRILESKLEAHPDLKQALYYYSGGDRWSTFQAYEVRYWEEIVKWVRKFWGIDLEPESNEMEELRAENEALKGKIEAIRQIVM